MCSLPPPCICALGVRPAAAADAPAALRVAVVDEPGGSALRVLDQAGNVPFPIAVCLIGSPADAELDARLTAVGRRGAPAWLIIRAPDGEPDMAAWQAALHGLLDRHGSSLAILEVSVDRQPARVASFALQVAATEARANRDAIRIAIGGPAMADRDRREAAISSGTRPVCGSAGPPGRRHRCGCGVAPAGRSRRVDHRRRRGRIGGTAAGRPGGHGPERARRAGDHGHVAGVARDRGDGSRHSCACARAGAHHGRDRQPRCRGRRARAACRRDRRDPASAPSSPVRQPDLRDLSRLPRRAGRGAAADIAGAAGRRRPGQQSTS